MRRMLTKLIICVVVGYIALCIVLYLTQEKLIFIPAKHLDRTPAVMGWAFEVVRVPVGKHETMGWYVPAPDESKGVILFSHGNAGNIAGRLESVGLFRDMGYDTLLYDYGGYGESTGRATEERCYADIRAMYDHLTKTREIPPAKIVLFGRSLGAGATAQLATEVDCGAVILESAFRSVPAMAAELYPWLPTRFFTRIKFDNESKVPKIKKPILIAHSTGDTLIPFAHGHALFEAAQPPKHFLEFIGDHNEGFWVSGTLYTNGVSEFLEGALASE